MSTVTKALKLGTSNPSCSQLSTSLRQYGGSMLGGIERLVKTGAVRGYLIGAVSTAMGLIFAYKVAEKISKDEEERLKRIRRRFREENKIKEAIVIETVEMPAINAEEKELFDTANIQN